MHQAHIIVSVIIIIIILIILFSIFFLSLKFQVRERGCNWCTIFRYQRTHESFQCERCMPWSNRIAIGKWCSRSVYCTKDDGQIHFSWFRYADFSLFFCEISDFVKFLFSKFLMLIFLHIGNTMTTEKIVDRIIKHRIEFERRNLKKEKKEIEAFEALKKEKQNEKAG